MHTIRPNAIRVKRFRELKADLRTNRDRLLVGIDIAKAEDVAQIRHAHTRVLDKQLRIPNTQAGFAAFWTHLQRRQAETGAAEIVCAVEPTGTYHETLARFLEAHGADVVLVSNHIAALNRRTLDGTWAKSDPKDAHNLCDLLERGMVLFYALPEGPSGTLRCLVRLLRHVRTGRAACKARSHNTLCPAGEPLPAAVAVGLPAPLQTLLPRAQRERAGPGRAFRRRWPSNSPIVTSGNPRSSLGMLARSGDAGCTASATRSRRSMPSRKIGMDYGARYWGLAKVSLQAIVTATVTNLKRLAKLLAPGQRLVPQAA